MSTPFEMQSFVIWMMAGISERECELAESITYDATDNGTIVPHNRKSLAIVVSDRLRLGALEAR
jgi:hypothetical protein